MKGHDTRDKAGLGNARTMTSATHLVAICPLLERIRNLGLQFLRHGSMSPTLCDRLLLETAECEMQGGTVISLEGSACLWVSFRNVRTAFRSHPWEER